jgi:hypothetical protein
VILRPGYKPKQMTLWFHPAMDFPDKGDILQFRIETASTPRIGSCQRRDRKDKLSSGIDKD